MLLVATAWAGPWVKSPGEVYAKAGASGFAAGAYVAPDGTISEGVETRVVTPHVYAEVGVIKYLQLDLQLPFVVSTNRWGETPYINRDGGDMEIGVTTGGKLGDAPVALQLTSKLPLYDNAELLQYGSSGALFPALGDGQVDLTAMLHAGGGLSLGKQGGWVAAGLGYRHRTEWWMGDSSEPDRELVDCVPWRAQVGWTPRLKGKDLGWWSLEGSGNHNVSEDEDSKESVQISSGIGWRFTRALALEIGGGVIPWARASSTGRTGWAGVSWSR